DMIDDNMATRYHEVRQLAQRLERDGARQSAAERRELLEQVQTSAPQYAWIGVAAASGTVLSSTGGLLEGVDVSKRPWFADIPSNVHVHDVHDAKLLAKHLPLDRGNPQRFVDLAFPVQLEENGGAAVLGAHLSWGWIGQLGRLFNAPVAERPVDIMILASDGTVLMGPDDAVGNKLDRLAPGVVLREQAPVELQWVDGKHYITTQYATRGKGDYPGLGWRVLARQNVDTAYAHVLNMQQRIYQIGIVLTLVFALCGWLLARRLTAPLLAAAEAAHRIEHASGSTLGVRGGFYEIHTLTRAFDSLLARLAQKRQQLNELNVALEHKVAQRTEALEAASRAKSEFVANMSHEILTPMNAVLGASHLLGNTRLSGEQRGYLELIESCGRSLLHVINDILDFSKIEAGKIQIEREAFDVGVLTEAAEAAMLSSGPRPGVELAIFVPSDLPPQLVGDAMRIRQVITNLVNNALKFTAAGEVLVELALQSGADAADPAAQLTISVRDSGIGMTPEQQQRLFQPIEQADTSTSRKYGGTGLGLTISRKLVALMDGAISVSSRAGEGSTFTVTLPLAVADPQRVPASEPVPALAGKLLFVDGYLPSLKALLHNAAFYGLPALSANSVSEGLALLRGDDAVALVLVSSGLYQAAPQQWQQAAQAAQARLVLMHSVPGSAHDETVFAATLSKPVTRRSLLRMLVQLAGPAEAAPGLAPEPSAPLLAGRRVLLVEDNPINQLVASRMLEIAGAIITLAENGRDALELVAMAQAPFDMILMDVQMPVMDGFETTRILRARGVRTPILAMSAGVSQSERGECLEAGMDGFISKPVDADDMFAIIAHWLAQ
ncbi:MAG: ATP-binding protein, partial [Duganella sp.]